jgi:hypothetical protein
MGVAHQSISASLMASSTFTPKHLGFGGVGHPLNHADDIVRGLVRGQCSADRIEPRGTHDLHDPGRVVLVDDHHIQAVGVGEVADAPPHELYPLGSVRGELERPVKVAGEVEAEQGRGHGDGLPVQRVG